MKFEVGEIVKTDHELDPFVEVTYIYDNSFSGYTLQFRALHYGPINWASRVTSIEQLVLRTKYSDEI